MEEWDMAEGGPQKRSKTYDNPQEKLDAHAKPPSDLKAIYKQYQKLNKDGVGSREDLIDCGTATHTSRSDRLRHAGGSTEDSQRTFLEFAQRCSHACGETAAGGHDEQPSPVFEVKDLPGRNMPTGPTREE